jgi:hypothetical protein
MKKIIILGLLLSTSIYSQTSNTTTQSSSKIKVYTPSSSVASSNETYKWAVKTDIFSFVSGEFPIIGEYRFAKKLSVEASAGVTYGLYNNFGILDEEYDGEGYTFETKAAMGSSFRAGIKYYPSSDYDAIEGWAFGLQIFTRTNNRDYKPDNNRDFDISSEKDSRNKTGISLTISKQVYSDSNIAFEYILGIGFASVTHDFHTYEEVYESGNEVSRPITAQSIKETVPNFQFGCRIGFGN